MDEKNIKTKKDITIYDIAKEAGVSPSTVSRVITNKSNVSDEKREVVNKLVKKYKFIPNAMARSLIDTKSNIIGIMAADIRNPYYATLIVECEKAAHKRGCTIMLSNILDDKEHEITLLEKFRAQRVDAIIQLGCSADYVVHEKSYLNAINRVCGSIPVIATGNLSGTPCHRVNIDHKQALSLVIDYLYDLGHTEIAFIGGNKKVKSTNMKLQQFIYHLGKYNFHLEEKFILEGQYNQMDGHKCMKELMKLSKQPTAIIAINDYTAIGIYNAIMEAGLSIPNDYSVVSFDNTFLTETVIPRLTGIDYNYTAFGEKLIEVTLDAIEKKENIPEEQFITPNLIIKDSCRKIN